MRHQHHEIGFPLEGLPGLNILRQFSGRKDLQFDQAKIRLFRLGPYPETVQGRIKGNILVIEACGHLLNRLPLAGRFVQHVDLQIDRRHAPPKIYTPNIDPIRRFHLDPGVLFRLAPHGHVPVIQHTLFVIVIS